jgi:hypothetical protein
MTVELLLLLLLLPGCCGIAIESAASSLLF